MRWLFVEGVDATGKTTLVERLTTGTGYVKEPEFSGTKIGELIRDNIRRADFFYLDKERNLRVAETLLLLADHYAKLMGEVRSGPLAVADRGLLSLRAYQFARIEADHGGRLAEAVDKAVVQLGKALEPSDAVTVVLTADKETILRRKAARGDFEPDVSEIKKIMSAQEFLMRAGEGVGAWVIDTSGIGIEQVVARVEGRVIR